MLVVLVVVVAGSASFFLFWWLSFYFGNLLLEKRGIVLSSNTAASFNHLPPLWHSKNSHPPIHTLTNRQDGATPTPTAAAFALHADWHFKLKLNALLPCIIMPFIYVHTFYFWVLILRTWLHSDLPTHAHMPSPHTKRTFNISACDLFLAHFPVKMEQDWFKYLELIDGEHRLSRRWIRLDFNCGEGIGKCFNLSFNAIYFVRSFLLKIF